MGAHPPEAQAYIRVLESRVAALEATVQQLREQVQQTSRTSSRPPSSDPPQALGKRPRREPSGRRPGGQPGHEGQTRALVPVKTVDIVIPVKPERCRHCQQPLQGEDPQPQRHQVTEIPPVKPVVTEYQLHRLVCPACGEVDPGGAAPGGAAGGFGPRVQATRPCARGRIICRNAPPKASAGGSVWGRGRSGHHRQPGAGHHAGSGRAGGRGTAPMSRAPVAHLGTKPGGVKATSGPGCGRRSRPWVTVFVVRRSRSGQGGPRTLGRTLLGVVDHRRWSAYTWYPTWRRQLCWAHLLRDIRSDDRAGWTFAEIGEALRDQTRQMFHWWHRVRDGTLAHVSFRPICSRSGARWNGCSRRDRTVASPRRKGPAGRFSSCVRHCGRLCATRGWNPRTTPPSGDPAWRPLAQGQLWDPEPRGFPLCRSDDDGGGDAQTTTSVMSSII